MLIGDLLTLVSAIFYALQIVFIDKYHDQGIKAVLWFKLFDPEGLPPELCVTTEEGELRTDVSNPAYLRILDEVLYRLLSADEGCYNADGFKIDFGFLNPIGRSVKTYSGKYGAKVMNSSPSSASALKQMVMDAAAPAVMKRFCMPKFVPKRSLRLFASVVRTCGSPGATV
mgnify:CR=1 FL=1